jgi:hypothetical protein
MIEKPILHYRVDNGFSVHVKLDFSTNSSNDAEIVHRYAPWVGLYHEMHGLIVVRLFGEVDLRPEIDLPRGRKLEMY